MAIRKRNAANLMRRLSDEERDAAIQAAGDVVIDMRSHFADKTRQTEIARAYRRPTWRDGGAA